MANIDAVPFRFSADDSHFTDGDMRALSYS